MVTLETSNVLGFKEQKDGPTYILRSKINGKRLKTTTGKSQWKRKGDASSALTYHLRIMSYSRPQMQYFDVSLAQGRILKVAATSTEKIPGFYFLGAYGEVIRKDTMKEVKQYVLENLVEITENV